MFSFPSLSVRKLRVNEACGDADECADPHARCLGGGCTCEPGYARVNDGCGMYTTHITYRIHAGGLETGGLESTTMNQ